MYKRQDYTPFESIDDYVGMVCDLLEIIPYKIIIHRLTADTPRKNLISPLWSYKKRTILNGIYHEMFQRGSIQGCKSDKSVSYTHLLRNLYQNS